MQISYSEEQYKRALLDVLDIYGIAEEKSFGSDLRRQYKACSECQKMQLRNAFQVFRYAFREWALTQDRGVVLRALMLADSRVREVRCNSKEMVIQVEDDGIAEALSRLLEGDGYVEEGN